MPTRDPKSSARADCPVCGAARSGAGNRCPVCDTDLTVYLEMSRFPEIIEDLAAAAEAAGDGERAALYGKLARDLAARDPGGAEGQAPVSAAVGEPDASAGLILSAADRLGRLLGGPGAKPAAGSGDPEEEA